VYSGRNLYMFRRRVQSACQVWRESQKSKEKTEYSHCCIMLSCSSHFAALKIGTVWLSVTSVNLWESAGRHISEDSSLYTQRYLMSLFLYFSLESDLKHDFLIFSWTEKLTTNPEIFIRHPLRNKNKRHSWWMRFNIV
jgi:hypothetical protein